MILFRSRVRHYPLVSLLLIFLVWPFAAYAAHGYTMLGGARTCEEWNAAKLKLRQDKDDFGAQLDVTGSMTWTLGYLSGLNSSWPIRKDVLEQVDHDLVQDWLDSYCAKHPKEYLFDAGTQLFEKLTK